jgi:Flp pilus assembly protein TadB
MDRKVRQERGQSLGSVATDEKTIEKLPPASMDSSGKQLRTVILGAVAYVLVVVALLVAGVTIGYLLLIFVVMMIGGLRRRPWVVEALNQTRPHQSAAFPIKGWQASGEAIGSLAREIEESGLPERIPVPRL